MRLPLLIGLLGSALLATGCGAPSHRTAETGAPPALLGDFLDDYGEERTVTALQWSPHQGADHSIERWETSEQWLLLLDPESGLWTRLDWVELDDAEWRWAFCLTAWDQPSADAAIEAGAGVADRANPRVGCNGSPFTRMRRHTLENR